jgi:hypothetical protein
MAHSKRFGMNGLMGSQCHKQHSAFYPLDSQIFDKLQEKIEALSPLWKVDFENKIAIMSFVKAVKLINTISLRSPLGNKFIGSQADSNLIFHRVLLRLMVLEFSE